MAKIRISIRGMVANVAPPALRNTAFPLSNKERADAFRTVFADRWAKHKAPSDDTLS